MELTENEKKYLYKSKSAIDNICMPLFNQTDIRYFDYQHYYRCGDLLALSTHPKFMESYLTKQYYPTLKELDNQLCNNDKLFVFMSEAMILPTKAAKDNPKKYISNIMLSKNYDIYHRIYFAKHYDEYIRICGFGICTDNAEILEYYLNSVELLERFIAYFECSAHDLINRKNQQLIHLPNFNPDETYIKPKILKSSYINFVPDKYRLIIDDKFIRFSQREMECLILKLKGGSAKSIGNLLNISNRTVEKILCNVYEKTDSLPRCKLANELRHAGIFKLFQNIQINT